MTVIATTWDGRTIALAASCGSSPVAVVERLAAESLTGSAVPLDGATLTTADGDTIAYTDVKELTFTEAF